MSPVSVVVFSMLCTAPGAREDTGFAERDREDCEWPTCRRRFGETSVSGILTFVHQGNLIWNAKKRGCVYFVRVTSRQVLTILCGFQQGRAFSDGRSHERASDLLHFILVFLISCITLPTQPDSFYLGNSFPGLHFLKDMLSVQALLSSN
jgi:hypothetical protein